MRTDEFVKNVTQLGGPSDADRATDQNPAARQISSALSAASAACSMCPVASATQYSTPRTCTIP